MFDKNLSFELLLLLSAAGMVLLSFFKRSYGSFINSVNPAIILVIMFVTKAGKRKSEGKSMGEPGKGTI